VAGSAETSRDARRAALELGSLVTRDLLAQEPFQGSIQPARCCADLRHLGPLGRYAALLGAKLPHGQGVELQPLPKHECRGGVFLPCYPEQQLPGDATPVAVEIILHHLR
jgi:hypothetical protein